MPRLRAYLAPKYPYIAPKEPYIAPNEPYIAPKEPFEHEPRAQPGGFWFVTELDSGFCFPACAGCQGEQEAEKDEQTAALTTYCGAVYGSFSFGGAKAQAPQKRWARALLGDTNETDVTP